jgi:hypothetical protein
MPDILIELAELHSGQQILLKEGRRFNVAANGRRFGKTIFGVDLSANALLDGQKVGYFVPTYKYLKPVWDELKFLLQPIISKKDESQKSLELITGGIIEFWSLDNPNAGRSRKYDLAIVDEAAFCPNLEEGWTRAIRATLIDLKGKAWFLSSPNGRDNYFYTLAQNEKKHPDWKTFQMPTSANPYIPVEEIEEAKTLLPTDVFNQEYMAEFVIFNGKLFFQHFVHDFHVKEVKYSPEFNLYLSFDFNITNTVLVIQKQYVEISEENYIEGIQVIDEYHNELLDLPTLCEQLQADYPGAVYVINGDASGNSGSALTKGNESAYDIIKGNFGISYDNFDIPNVNPSHKDSYILCNSVLKNIPIAIHPRCVGLINDMDHVKVKQEKGKFEIVKTDDKLTHHADPLRYFIEANFRNTLSFMKRTEEDAA